MILAIARRVRHLFGWRNPPDTSFKVEVWSRDSLVLRTSMGLIPVSFSFVPRAWLASDVEIAGWSLCTAFVGDEQNALPPEMLSEVEAALIKFFHYNGYKATCTLDRGTWGRNPLKGIRKTKGVKSS